MNGALVWIILGGGLLLLGAWRHFAAKLRVAVPFVAGATVLVGVALSFVVKVAVIVFSVDGLLWSFGLGPPTPYPVAVRVGTWGLVVAGIVLIEWCGRRMLGASPTRAVASALVSVTEVAVERARAGTGSIVIETPPDDAPARKDAA